VNEGLRLFFDECCSPRLPRELFEFYHKDYPGLAVRHVLDNYKAGTPEPDWLAPLREDKSWLVITKDCGKKSPEHKLPLICQEWGITHVVFTAALIHAGFSQHKAALVTVWPQLVLLRKLPLGTQVKLGFGRLRADIPTFELRVSGKPLASVLVVVDK
jgi:hypothetical protein